MGKGRFESLRRNVETRETNKSILVVCGGEETEPNYFDSFETYSGCVVHIKRSNLNPMNLVMQTKKLKEDDEYDSTWCVFDKDDFTDFDDAIELANQNEIKVAYSNKCFELWVLMHFAKTPKLSQKALENETNNIFKNKLKIKTGYTKNMNNLYNILLDRQKTALATAKRCYNERHLYGDKPSTQEGVTTIHFLVTELNENSPNRWN